MPDDSSVKERAGLYIHIPFCRSKCPYCGFVSLAAPKTELVAAYLDALARQMGMLAAHPWTQTVRFTSLFVGGGTPTTLAAPALAGLIRDALARFPFAQAPEVTVEANPGTVSGEDLAALRDAGVNRLSLGVQSLADLRLAAIGRGHTAAEAREAVRLARSADFPRLSLDLIYGLPGQNAAELAETLAAAVRLAPDHISLYELTIEDDTPFARRHAAGELMLPDEDELVRMEEDSVRFLEGAGFRRYEISNFAQPGAECRHNVNYWENGAYVGLGASAVSCFGGLRVKNVAAPEEFIRLLAADRHPFAEAEALSLEASFRESVMLGMRMIAGVSLPRLKARYGLAPLEYYGETLAGLLDNGLVAIAGDRLRLTPRGLPVANQVLARLV